MNFNDLNSLTQSKPINKLLHRSIRIRGSAAGHRLGATSGNYCDTRISVRTLSLGLGLGFGKYLNREDSKEYTLPNPNAKVRTLILVSPASCP